MQPYENDPQDMTAEEHEAWLRDDDASLARVARIAQLTDEDVRAMGRKEVYPGYFRDDPRHPYFSVEDRYLMDHPARPEWRLRGWTTEMKRGIRQELTPSRKWDEEQFTGEPMPTESLPPRPAPKIIPIKAGEAEQVVQDARLDLFEDPYVQGKTVPRQSGFWICRVCRRSLALWPTERALRLKPFGLSLTVVFRSPIACTNCRVFEFPTIQALGREDHRKFWQRVIACWEHPQLLIPHKWYQRARRLRNRLRKTLWRSAWEKYP